MALSNKIKKKSSNFWRSVFVALIIFQFCVVLSTFMAQPEHKIDGHISPHQLHDKAKKKDVLIRKLERSDSPNNEQQEGIPETSQDGSLSDAAKEARAEEDIVNPPKIKKGAHIEQEDIAQDSRDNREASQEERLEKGDDETPQTEEIDPPKVEKKGNNVVADAVRQANKRALSEDHDFDIHQHDFHLDGGHDTKSVWNTLSSIPDWMKEYFSFHIEKRSTLTESNWRDQKYLIMSCVREDAHCGGASDRLKPIPYLLWQAYRTNRIFLIHWTRPCRLEEFLVPNILNWTVPSFLPVSNGTENGVIAVKTEGIYAKAKTDSSMVRTRMQSYEGGQLDYENQTTSTYNEVYHDLFRLMFEPSPAIAKILRGEMHEANLVPGEYAVAHYRAFYARASRKDAVIIDTAINAVNCASRLRPGGPVYFASDSLLALQTVREYAQRFSYPVVTIENQEPLHLDKAGNWSTRSPSDFYSIFVDLYLMGMGRCLTFGQGGFGRFGLLLGYDASCTNRHVYKSKMCDCGNWTPSIE